MTRLAKQLPEYDIVRAMYGVGETTAVQLMAEIGDVRRFPRRSSIVGFAGVDPAVDQSGKHSAKSVPTTKRGSPHLRKTLYQIVCTYLKRSLPVDEPVYQFLDKKRSEGKPLFCLHDSRAEQVPAHLLCPCERVPGGFLTHSRTPHKDKSDCYFIPAGEAFSPACFVMPLFSAVQILRDFFHFSY